jgi:hypothetical protein
MKQTTTAMLHPAAFREGPKPWVHPGTLRQVDPGLATDLPLLSREHVVLVLSASTGG